MRSKTQHTKRDFWRGLALLLAVFAQMFAALPAGASLSGDLQVVICTPNGVKSVSWTEVTGEEAPPAEEEQGHQQCSHCCVKNCRSVLAGFQQGSDFPHLRFTERQPVITAEYPPVSSHPAGPALPSRSPPAI